MSWEDATAQVGFWMSLAVLAWIACSILLAVAMWAATKLDALRAKRRERRRHRLYRATKYVKS